MAGAEDGKTELAQDAVLVLALAIGAALEWYTGGDSWLLLTGAVGLGWRILAARDEKRVVIATIGGCVAWFLLHLVLRTGAAGGHLRVAVEVLTFSILVIVFWAARLRMRDRVAVEASRMASTQDATRINAERLKKLEMEYGNMNRESEEWTRLFGAARDIVEVIREEEMLGIIREAAQAHLKLPVFVLLLVHDGVVRIRAQKGFDEGTLGSDEHPVDSTTLASWFVNQREPVLVDDLSSDGRFAGSMFPYRSLTALPMWASDEKLGALIAFDTRVRAFTRQDFMRANILAQQLALGIVKTSLYARIEELSITDGLTKLYRRGYFLDRFEGEMGRARRYNRPVSLLMGDIDHFKLYNDSYGHPEGDEVLRRVSRVMEEHFSRPAINCRYGGEEFAVLLPEVHKEKAEEMANRFREAFGSTPPSDDADRKPLTISVGVASFPDDAQTRRDLISRSDQALYRAKSLGRNRVCICEPASERSQ